MLNATHWSPAPSLSDLNRGRGSLTQGMEGESVRALQQQLNARGYHLTTDGRLGGATMRALQEQTGSSSIGHNELQKLGFSDRSGFERVRGPAAAAPHVAEAAAPRSGFRLGDLFRPRSRAAGAGAVENPVKRMSQLDYKDRLGNGKYTIQSSGCFLSSMAMASTRITGKDTDPRKANATVRAAGGFSGSALEVPQAARALGMKVTGRQAYSTSNSGAMLTELDRNLNAGRPAVAGVDFHEGRSSSVSNADHFITITGRTRSGDYTAVDPLGGNKITLKRGADGTLSSGSYRVSEMVFLDRR